MVTARDVQRIVTRALRPLTGRVRGMIRRATLGALKSGAGQSATITTTAADADDDVELFEPYGFTSSPLPGAEGVALRVGGERAGTILVCVGDRTSRLAGVGPGEVAVYHPGGASVVLRASGMVEVTPGPGAVVQLGGPAAALAVARATDPVVIPSLEVLQTAIGSWVPASNDGGAALKTALAAWLGAAVNDGTIAAGGTGATST